MEQHDLQTLKGIGQARAKVFARLGLFTCEELLRFYPYDYQDRRAKVSVSNLLHGMTACVCGMVALTPQETMIRKGLLLTKLTVVEDTGRLHITFFNAPYAKTALQVGEVYVFFGKIEVKNNRFEMVNPVFEPESKQGQTTGRLMPIYHLTAGLTQYAVRSAVSQSLALWADAAPDILPPTMRQAYGLCDIAFALREIHAPTAAETLQQARRRLAFDELFLLSVGLSWMKQGRQQSPGPRFTPLALSDFEAALPFRLTGAQRRAIAEAQADLTSGTLMSRLVQGDVGSGKTMVAAALCLMAAHSGTQAALMAPTEILAEQHYATLAPLLTQFGVSTGLLTGRLSPKRKKALQAEIAAGTLTFVIGTHALLSEQVTFANLGIIITDEQHRFGVNQRISLARKGQGVHTLVMSATPIPRTLALLLYGELDVSVLDELPPGRTPVKTYVVDMGMRARIDTFIDKTVKEGGQVFVVCPLIECTEDTPDTLQEAVSEQARLQSLFPARRVGLVHGKLKEKAAVMADFAAGLLHILVSTTVIEVGVDVPNANLMVVQNAERFGLAQLHQLRGRVGRGKRESFCILFHTGGNESLARLKLLEQSTDGFAIAQADLALRGPGEFFGTRQHGLPTLRVADLSVDTPLLEQARQAAQEVLAEDPQLLTHTALRRHVDALMEKLGE